MSGDEARERAIADSWRANAGAWTRAVRSGGIASRRQVTDRAIIDVVVDTNPATVLDIGCGEGWLVRALADRGIAARGVDFTEALIGSARRAGGRFDVVSYAELGSWPAKDRFDTAVCNFSLIGERSTRDVFRAVRRLVDAGGCFIVQTLHPVTACGDAPYEDGWHAGSWQGFSDEFTDPAPWYFRTLESWRRLFDDHAMALTATHEPPDPDTGKPVSIIFVAATG